MSGEAVQERGVPARGTRAHNEQVPLPRLPNMVDSALNRLPNVACALFATHGSMCTPHGSMCTPHGSMRTPHSSMCTPHGRSLGDLAADQLGCIPTPTISHLTLSRASARFIILASDGIWEFMKSEVAVEIVGRFHERGGSVR